MKPKSEDNIAGHQFRWLRAIRDGIAAEQTRKRSGARRAMLTHLDALLAIDLTEFMQGRLECFRSAAALARACGCSESAAEAGLRRLVAAGFLEKMAPAERDSNGKGRPATRYRVPTIFPVLEGGKSTEVFPSCEGENGATETAFFPSGEGILFPSPEGNDQRDDQKGAGAPSAPLPPSSSDTDVDLIEQVGPVAHERDCPPLASPPEDGEPILDPFDRDLPEIPEDVVERFRQAAEALPPHEPEADPEDLDEEIPICGDPEQQAEVVIDRFQDLPEPERISLLRLSEVFENQTRAFVDQWFQAFMSGDEDATDAVYKMVWKLLPAWNGIQDRFLQMIRPIEDAIRDICVAREYDEDSIDAALSDFVECLRFEREQRRGKG